MIEVALLHVVALLYGAATVVTAAGVRSRQEVPAVRLRLLLVAGGFLHGIAVVARSFELGQLAVGSFGDSLSFFGFLLVAIFLAVQIRLPVAALGAVVAPLAFALAASATVLRDGAGTLPPVLHSWWLPVHVTLAFLGDAVFALAFSASALYLFQERRLKTLRGRGRVRHLPSLETLDRLNYNCLVWGLVMLTLGIVSGIVWAHDAWEHNTWATDPKLIFSVAVWVIYVVLLQGRMLAGWRGRFAARVTITGFAVLLLSLVGVNLLGLGAHGRVF